MSNHRLETYLNYQRKTVIKHRIKAIYGMNIPFVNIVT